MPINLLKNTEIGIYKGLSRGERHGIYLSNFNFPIFKSDFSTLT